MGCQAGAEGAVVYTGGSILRNQTSGLGLSRVGRANQDGRGPSRGEHIKKKKQNSSVRMEMEAASATPR